MIPFESLPECLVLRKRKKRLDEQRVKRLAASRLHNTEGGCAATGGVEGFEEARHRDDTRGDGNRLPARPMGTGAVPLLEYRPEGPLDLVGHSQPLGKAAGDLDGVLQSFSLEFLPMHGEVQNVPGTDV